MTAIFSGYAPALPTPFTADGQVDGEAFELLCERQIEMGAAALVVCGTTGEASTLDPAEHHVLVRAAVDVARGRVPVIAGAGCNSTSHAIELTEDAEAGGADGILSVVPYYNKPTQRGLVAHFSAIAQATALPVILYDVPSRTACALADETVARLAEVPNIVGLKDATGDLLRPVRLRALVGPDFGLWSGEDITAPGFIAQGGDGCISVTSNVAPGLCQRVWQTLRGGRMSAAKQLTTPLAQLTAVLFCETNPTPVKYALSLLGMTSPYVRLPLVELTEGSRTAVTAAIERVRHLFPDDVMSPRVRFGAKTVLATQSR
jgi:4-hydroxy-tetrahydrodipicolinate synthase